MTKYVKLPIEVEATQWFKHGDHIDVFKSIDFQVYLQVSSPYFIQTIEAAIPVYPGDWIITGVEGEHYPCKDSVFKATYKEVEDDETIFGFIKPMGF